MSTEAHSLRRAGVDAIYGRPRTGSPVYEAASLRVAELLAAAHQRVYGLGAAVSRDDGALTRSDGRPIELDATPADDDEQEEAALARLASAANPAMLVGPGVVDAGAVPSLHAFATAGSLGVLNTWGAKGVFDWRSRHHLATVGLQEKDFELGGLGAADLIVAAGIDPLEAPPNRWRLTDVVEVAPTALGRLAERWRRPFDEVPVPPLRSGLGAVTQEGWAATGTPIAPSRITLHYGQVLGAGGLVAADPGLSGFWVARTFATTRLRSAIVPADAGAIGFAAACAVVARLRQPLRPVLAVVDGPVDDRVREVVDAGAALGVSVGVEVWDEGAVPLTAEEHLARLDRLTATEQPTFVPLATDRTQLQRMIDVAGPIVAWR